MNQLKDIIDYLFNLIKIWVIIQPWETALKVRLGKKIIILKKEFILKSHTLIQYINKKTD